MTDVFGDIRINHLSCNELAHDIDYFQKNLSQLLQNLKKITLMPYTRSQHTKKRTNWQTFSYFLASRRALSETVKERKKIFLFFTFVLNFT